MMIKTPICHPPPLTSRVVDKGGCNSRTVEALLCGQGLRRWLRAARVAGAQNRVETKESVRYFKIIVVLNSCYQLEARSTHRYFHSCTGNITSKPCQTWARWRDTRTVLWLWTPISSIWTIWTRVICSRISTHFNRTVHSRTSTLASPTAPHNTKCSCSG